MQIKDHKIAITRDEMKAIKRQDHKQIESTLTKVYQLGAEKEVMSRKAAQKMITDAVMETLKEVKGIGEKRRVEFAEIFARKVNAKTHVKE